MRRLLAIPGVRNVVLYNSSRERLRAETEAFAASVPEGALVLDAGAGTGPYRDLFSHARYESADFEKVDKPYAESTYVCDLTEIPTEDGRFDFILFNQVLEHLSEPKLALAELHRVLKPGGKMLYTGPLFYEEHEKPYDFYRYTQFGLRYLFGETGFEIERLDWLEGYLGTAAYQLTGLARFLPSRSAELGGGLLGHGLAGVMLSARLVFGACAMGLHRLEMRAKFTDRGYPKNYLIIAAKSRDD